MQDPSLKAFGSRSATVMLTDLLPWISAHEGFVAYAILGIGALTEYVLPFLPGDTLTLFGVFLSVSAGYRGAFVFLAISAGSLVGSLIAYGLGRYWVRDESRIPKFFTGPKMSRALRDVQDRYRKSGNVYLVVNRFLPGVRGIALLAAGMSSVPLWRVIVFGGVSSLAWNGLLFGVAYVAGDNWPLMERIMRNYGLSVSAAVLCAVLIYFYRPKKNA